MKIARSRHLKRSGSHTAPGPFAALAALLRRLILRATRSRTDMSTGCPSAAVDP